MELHPTLLEIGKLSSQSLMATNVTGLQPSRLLYVTDNSSRLRFLVDTGAQISVIPATATDQKAARSSLILQAVNNSPIHSTRSLSLNLGLRRTLRWVFVIADTTTPILGADFLRHYNLAVDLSRHRLVDTTTNLTIKGILSSGTSPSPTLLPRHASNPFQAILEEFPAVTQPGNIRETQCYTPHPHQWAPGLRPNPSFGSGTTQNRTRRVRPHAGARDHQAIVKQLGLSASYGS